VEKIATQLQLNAVVTDPYTAWSGGAAFGADSNGDGVPNGIAWALGAANVSSQANALLPFLDSTTEPDFLIFTYRRKDEAFNDANTTIKMEYGSDLIGWTEAVAGANIIMTPTNDIQPGIDSVQVKILKQQWMISEGEHTRPRVSNETPSSHSCGLHLSIPFTTRHGERENPQTAVDDSRRGRRKQHAGARVLPIFPQFDRPPQISTENPCISPSICFLPCAFTGQNGHFRLR
jgi:hypothetical protein